MTAPARGVPRASGLSLRRPATRVSGPNQRPPRAGNLSRAPEPSMQSALNPRVAAWALASVSADSPSWLAGVARSLIRSGGQLTSVA